MDDATELRDAVELGDTVELGEAAKLRDAVLELGDAAELCDTAAAATDRVAAAAQVRADRLDGQQRVAVRRVNEAQHFDGANVNVEHLRGIGTGVVQAAHDAVTMGPPPVAVHAREIQHISSKTAGRESGKDRESEKKSNISCKRTQQ